MTRTQVVGSLALGVAALTLGLATPVLADDGSTTEVRATLAPNGDAVRLATVWGKRSGAALAVGNAKAVSLHKGEAVGSLVTGHGKVVIAMAVDDAKAPFLVQTLDGKTLGKAIGIARPDKRSEGPFAVAITATPDGFTAFFQDVETSDPTAAHTYMVELDADGVPGKATEIAVPWALGDAVWNGNGYHLALFYSGDERGVRLSMVTTTRTGQPQGHPDWASAGGFVSDVHLVATDGKVRAFYRGGAGDRILESDVTKIGSWGTEPAKAKDRGGIGGDRAIAVTAKGDPTAVKTGLAGK